jgi:hypothetical protein
MTNASKRPCDPVVRLKGHRHDDLFTVAAPFELQRLDFAKASAELNAD